MPSPGIKATASKNCTSGFSRAALGVAWPCRLSSSVLARTAGTSGVAYTVVRLHNSWSTWAMFQNTTEFTGSVGSTLGAQMLPAYVSDVQGCAARARRASLLRHSSHSHMCGCSGRPCTPSSRACCAMAYCCWRSACRNAEFSIFALHPCREFLCCALMFFFFLSHLFRNRNPVDRDNHRCRKYNTYQLLTPISKPNHLDFSDLVMQKYELLVKRSK